MDILTPPLKKPKVPAGEKSAQVRQSTPNAKAMAKLDSSSLACWVCGEHGHTDTNCTDEYVPTLW